MLEIQDFKIKDIALFERMKELGPLVVLSPVAVLIIHAACYVAGFSALISLVASTVYLIAAFPARTEKEGSKRASSRAITADMKQPLTRIPGSTSLEDYLSRPLTSDGEIVTPGNYTSNNESVKPARLACSTEDGESYLLNLISRVSETRDDYTQPIDSQIEDLDGMESNNPVDSEKPAELLVETIEEEVVTADAQGAEPEPAGESIPRDKADDRCQEEILAGSVETGDYDLSLDDQKVQDSIEEMEAVLANTFIESFDRNRFNEIVKEQLARIKESMNSTSGSQEEMGTEEREQGEAKMSRTETF